MAVAGYRIRLYERTDERDVLALWARSLVEWPLAARSFRAGTARNRRLVAVLDGVTVGYVAAARAGEEGQVTALVVDPVHRRRGVGTRLLAQVTDAFAREGVRTLWAGSGVARYFWPGVPELDPGGWGFLQAQGFKRQARVADLIADITGFEPPEWVMARAGGRVRFEVARPRDAAAVIELQRRHFPFWAPVYEGLVEQPGAILTARIGPRIVGACTLEGPGEHDFMWRKLIPGPVGAFGCVGVDPGARGAGIGLAMVARACELLAARGTETCYCAYTHLGDWYAQLGFEPWRTYTIARSRLPRPSAALPEGVI